VTLIGFSPCWTLQQRLLADARKFDHVTPLLVNLHWLRVPERIQYKLCVLVHRCKKRSSTTVSVRVNPAAVRRRLTSSTTFCIHGWSSGAGYVSLNHRRPCFRRRRSTCTEQSSSRSAPIPDIFKTHLKSHLFNLSFPSVWLHYWLHHWLFLYRALEAACAAYASLNLSLLHYITLQRIPCRRSGVAEDMLPVFNYYQRQRIVPCWKKPPTREWLTVIDCTMLVRHHYQPT